jgi:ABC-type phosphate transport system substrate-binding protein
MVDFWQWFYSAQTAQDMAGILSFVIPPVQIRAAHGIDTLLTTNMYCRDSLVAPAERTEQSLGIGTSLASSLYALYPTVYNNLASTNGTIVYQTATSDNALQSLLYNEVDFATTFGFVMDQTTLASELATGAVVQLPLFSSRFQIIYNLPSLTAANAAVNEIVMDYALLSDILSGDVTQWNDIRIAALNPGLAAAGTLPSLNITRVFATSGEREAERVILETVRYWSATTSSPLNLTFDSSSRIAAYYDQAWLDKASPLLIAVASVDKVQATVTNTPGGLGIAIVDGSLEATTQRIRLLRGDGTGQPVVETSLASYRCQADTFDNVGNRFYVIYSFLAFFFDLIF